MNSTLQTLVIAGVIIYYLLLFFLLKRGSLNLKYTILWIASGAVMLLVAAFPQFLNWFAHTIGVYEPTNALFAIVFFCVIIILMSLTSIVSKQNEKNKRLVQSMAMMEKRIRILENSL